VPTEYKFSPTAFSLRLRSVHCVAILVTSCYAKPVLHPSKGSSQPYLRPRPKWERKLRTSLRNRVAAKALLLHVGLTAALARPQITEVITASNAAIHLGWYGANINEKVAHTFVNHATQLNNLRAYDSRPLTMVLPAFSHKSREHLFGNMMALHVVMPEMLKLMAAWKVAFIYSASAIGSALLECYIPDLLRRVGLGSSQFAARNSTERRGLGASGAITALEVYICLAGPCATIETKIPFLDYRAREYPLWLCVIALVAGDLYGLTRREGEVREGDEEGVTIGHDAHIAGAAVGAAFWLTGTALVLPLKIAGKPFSRSRNHRRENHMAQRGYQRQERESRRRRERRNREYESQNRRKQRRREREMRRHYHNSRLRGRNPVSSILTFFRSSGRSLSFSPEEKKFLLCFVLLCHILLSYTKTGTEAGPASISDLTTPRGRAAVVLFTIDRLARSPRTTARRRTSKKAPDP